MEKSDLMRLILAPILLIGGFYSILYSDFFLGEIVSVVAIVLFVNYLIRKIKYKDEVRADEMIKRISGISSDFAFVTTVVAIAILSIALHYYPALIDAKGVLVLLLTVIVVSKIACQLYYIKIKRAIGF